MASSQEGCAVNMLLHQSTMTSWLHHLKELNHQALNNFKIKVKFMVTIKFMALIKGAGEAQVDAPQVEDDDDDDEPIQP
jgi:hypothetical protein